MKDREQDYEKNLGSLDNLEDIDDVDDGDEKPDKFDAYLESHPEKKDILIKALLLSERRELAAIRALPKEF